MIFHPFPLLLFPLLFLSIPFHSFLPSSRYDSSQNYHLWQIENNSVTAQNWRASSAIPDLCSKNNNFPNHTLGRFASELMGSTAAFSVVAWSNFKSKLERTLIYHSASCYLLFLLHPLPSLGIMIKQRSSRISYGQSFLCAPSLAWLPLICCWQSQRNNCNRSGFSYMPLKNACCF